MTLENDLLDGVKAASQYTGLGERQLYHLAAKGQIPHRKLGQRLYFRKSELDRHFSAEGL